MLSRTVVYQKLLLMGVSLCLLGTVQSLDARAKYTDAFQNANSTDAPKAIHLSPEALKKFEGKYTVLTPPDAPEGVMPFPPMTITAGDNQLLVDLGNGAEKRKMAPLFEMEFFDLDNHEARFTFSKDDKGQITGITIKGALPGTILKAVKQKNRLDSLKDADGCYLVSSIKGMLSSML